MNWKALVSNQISILAFDTDLALQSQQGGCSHQTAERSTALCSSTWQYNSVCALVARRRRLPCQPTHRAGKLPEITCCHGLRRILGQGKRLAPSPIGVHPHWHRQTLRFSAARRLLLQCTARKSSSLAYANPEQTHHQHILTRAALPTGVGPTLCLWVTSPTCGVDSKKPACIQLTSACRT